MEFKMPRLILPRGTPPHVAEKLNAAPESVKNRLIAELDADRKIEAERAATRAEVDSLTEILEGLETRIAAAEREVQRSGKPYVTQVEKTGPDGRVAVEMVPTPYIANMKDERDAIRIERRKLLDRKYAPQWGRFILDQLDEHRNAALVADDDVPQDVEPSIDAYRAAFANVARLEKGLKAAIDAPLVVQEGIERAMKRLDSLAAAPGLGGFIRGNFTNARGDVVLGPMPNCDFAWPTAFFGDQIDVPDAVRIIAWALGPQLKELVAAEFARNWTLPNAMTLAAKSEAVPRLESELWQARRECEAIFIACRSAGITVNRPRSTPPEIVLGCVPFKIARSVKPAAVDQDDDDFEADANEEAAE
jgi:hypothetical protein